MITMSNDNALKIPLIRDDIMLLSYHPLVGRNNYSLFPSIPFSFAHETKTEINRGKQGGYFVKSGFQGVKNIRNVAAVPWFGIWLLSVIYVERWSIGRF